MVDVTFPSMIEATLDIHLVADGVDHGMEHKVVENKAL